MKNTETPRDIIDLIDQLGAATSQMQRAAADRDWTLAARVQATRATLIQRIETMVATAMLGEAELRTLGEIRDQEAKITLEAIAHRNSLGHAIAQLKPEKTSRTGKKKMLDKTYGISGRQH